MSQTQTQPATARREPASARYARTAAAHADRAGAIAQDWAARQWDAVTAYRMARPAADARFWAGEAAQSAALAPSEWRPVARDAGLALDALQAIEALEREAIAALHAEALSDDFERDLRAAGLYGDFYRWLLTLPTDWTLPVHRNQYRHLLSDAWEAHRRESVAAALAAEDALTAVRDDPRHTTAEYTAAFEVAISAAVAAPAADLAAAIAARKLERRQNESADRLLNLASVALDACPRGLAHHPANEPVRVAYVGALDAWRAARVSQHPGERRDALTRLVASVRAARAARRAAPLDHLEPTPPPPPPAPKAPALSRTVRDHVAECLELNPLPGADAATLRALRAGDPLASLPRPALEAVLADLRRQASWAEADRDVTGARLFGEPARALAAWLEAPQGVLS